MLEEAGEKKKKWKKFNLESLCWLLGEFKQVSNLKFRN